MRAFVLALSFEDMRSVEHFVHNYPLERNDVDIGELGSRSNAIARLAGYPGARKRLEALTAIQALIVEFTDCSNARRSLAASSGSPA